MPKPYSVPIFHLWLLRSFINRNIFIHILVIFWPVLLFVNRGLFILLPFRVIHFTVTVFIQYPDEIHARLATLHIRTCGLILLLGELGTGKTTVCYHVYEHGDFQSAYVNNPFLNELEFLQKVNRQLGIPASQRSRRFLIDALKHYLLRQHRSGKRVLLIVDEAHRLGLPILDQILILSNLQLPDAQLLQIVLAAQPTLLHSFRHPRLSSLNERIGVRHHLQRLDRTNTIDYIYHRLRRAGCTNPSLFTSNALDTIWRASRGTPRLINHLCEHALGEAYCRGKKTVGKREVKCVTEDPMYRPLFPTREKFWSMRLAFAGSVLTLCACLFGALWYFGLGGGLGLEPIKQARQFPSEHRTTIREEQGVEGKNEAHVS